jgi:hypothetical protein
MITFPKSIILLQPTGVEMFPAPDSPHDGTDPSTPAHYEQLPDEYRAQLDDFRSGSHNFPALVL